MSKRFLMIATILLLVILLGLAALLAMYNEARLSDARYNLTPLVGETSYIPTALAATKTAKSYTSTPSITPPLRQVIFVR